jgi:heme-degrading monooxygenase HmoA
VGAGINSRLSHFKEASGAPSERRQEMAVKIIIRRRVPKGKEAQLRPLLLDLRSKAINQHGYISGETLRNADDPEDYVVISTWKSVDDWKIWEGKEERKEIHRKIEALLGEKATLGVYFYG